MAVHIQALGRIWEILLVVWVTDAITGFEKSGLLRGPNTKPQRSPLRVTDERPDNSPNSNSS